MTKSTPSLFLATLLAFGLYAVPAQALTRTFVSTAGKDTNDCDRDKPCRTFAGALVKTTRGGEIDVLDPGDYQ